jgi:hypothetical protein
MAAREGCTTERTENTEGNTFAPPYDLCGLCGGAPLGRGHRWAWGERPFLKEPAL